MSISTPGGAPERVPSTVSPDKKRPAGGKPPASKSGGAKPGAGKGGRKPIKAVQVNQSRNWGPIALAGGVVLAAVAIIGWAGYASMKGSVPWEERAAEIDGIVNYRDGKDPAIIGQGHKAGALQYKVTPPVGGEHNPNWQNCMGDIYTAPIANEYAVHALEHGAVWITYKLGTPEAQVKQLADRVAGKEYMMLSPVEGLDKNVSLQAWGYQLKLDTFDDPRIDEFIRTLRVKASMEPGAACSSGVTTTGPVEAAPAGS
ncbi:MAG TPA: DUF3105 domain-containing protein [Actinoplanes sp.]|nr:DUF3105 domain-containing protein [Actinoplanes sp.]